MRLTENFWIHEFDCRDGTRVPYKYVPNITRLADCLQVIRDEVKGPIQIVSGYRTVTHNAKIGGAPRSQHLIGKAADIVSQKHTPKQLAAIIEKLIRQGKIKQGGIGIYKSYVHYDIRGTRARW